MYVYMFENVVPNAGQGRLSIDKASRHRLTGPSIG